MFRQCTLITFLSLAIFSSCAQSSLKEYEGNWEGSLMDPHLFNFEIRLEQVSTSSYNISLTSPITSIHRTITTANPDRISHSLDDGTHLDLIANDQGTEMSGFLKSGILMYHVQLTKGKDSAFTGAWNPFMVEGLKSRSIFLSVESYDNGNFAFYPFFGDQRFTGTWCADFTQQKDLILFRDFKTGLKFSAKLLADEIELRILLAESTIATTRLTRSKTAWELGIPTSASQAVMRPRQIEDGWPTTTLENAGIKAPLLKRLMDSVEAKSLVNTHSVLIARQGKLAFEAYFDGFHHNLPHDQRSASKSIASAMTGIAINDGLIESEDQFLFDLLPASVERTKDPRQAKIRIKDLLTMSSGIDAIDFGIDRRSLASEDNYQSSADWLKTVLKAPMINTPGTHAFYGSANPFLLGVCLSKRLSGPLEWYMDRKLLAPLGITNYIIQTENTGTTPYFGGGMYLTPRDMLKFGQLYLDRGKWKGKQLISEDWVEASFKRYFPLENTNDKSEYGYLWWHKTYQVGNQTIESIDARGAGGQYICVIPALEAVIVVTSGNFRNGRFKQPENILQQYILPAMLK